MSWTKCNILMAGGRGGAELGRARLPTGAGGQLIPLRDQLGSDCFRTHCPSPSPTARETQDVEPLADVPAQITLSQCGGGGEESDPPAAAEKRHCPLLLPYRLGEEIKPRLCQDDCDLCLSGPSVEQLMFTVLLLCGEQQGRLSL